MSQPDQRDRDCEALRERLSRLSEASLRINDSLDFEAVLQGLVNISPVGVIVFDPQTGAPESFNREAARIVDGLLEGDQVVDDLLGVVTCVRSDGRELSLGELLLAGPIRAGETVRAEEIVLRVPDGRSVDALLSATPIHTEEGVLVSFVVTLQDMTPLQQQERLRAEFLAMVSHELRMPLSAIKGSVTTLLETVGDLDPAETAQFLHIIRDQSDQMRCLIGDLLDVARIKTGTLPVAPEPADLRLLVDEAVSRFLASGTTSALDVKLAPDLPLAMADRRRIVQVLTNLLSNADRYAPEGSPILVTAAREGVHVAVSVIDQGQGIPAEMLPELFRKFSPERDANHASGADGSGLGLAISKGIVETHGGRIRAESDGPGLGARFTFTLPAAESATAVPAAVQCVAPREAHRQVRVLAVDDDPLALRYVHDVLVGAGYAPIVTGDPDDVPRLIAEDRPHLALVDLGLPGSAGIRVMNEIQRTADLPVIFVSAYGQDEAVVTALEMGATDYVVKPFSPTELAARIKAALRRQIEPFIDEPSVHYAADGLGIDYARRRVTVAGEPVDLTATEYAVLYELAVHAPRVLTHSVLLQRVWGPERVGEPWLVRDIVKRLRHKLGDSAGSPRYIHTEPRVGYRMAGTEPPGTQQV